jgi:hypothetical protein
MNSGVVALVFANLCVAAIGGALLVATGFVDKRRSTWPRLGAAYLVGIAVVVIPVMYLALAGVAVGWTSLSLVAACLGVVAWLRLRGAGAPAPEEVARSGARQVWPARIGAVVITLVAVATLLQFGRAIAIRPLLESDGWAVWALKARVLFETSDAAETLRLPWYGPPHYPLAMPMLEALGARSIGRFDGSLIDLQLLGLVIACIGAIWAATRTYVHSVVAAVTLLAVLAAPQFLGQLWTNYVDVPLAAVMAVAVTVSARWLAGGARERWLLPLIVMSLSLAGLLKNEGLLFAIACCIALASAAAVLGWRPLRASLLAGAAFAAVVLPWRVYAAVHDLRTADYQLSNVFDLSYLAEQSHRVRPAASELLSEITDSGRWGPLWIVIVLGIAAGLLGNRRLPALFAGIWVTLAFAGLLLTYWISVLPLENDLSNSSYRTVATIVIAGTAVVPVLLGEAWRRESAVVTAPVRVGESVSDRRTR